MYHIIKLLSKIQYHLAIILSSYFVPGTILGPEDIVVKKTHNIPSSSTQKAHILVGDIHMCVCVCVCMSYDSKYYEDKTKEDWW